MEYTAYKAVLTLKIHKRLDYGTASAVIFARKLGGLDFSATFGEAEKSKSECPKMRRGGLPPEPV
jgi:hypothetical protein